MKLAALVVFLGSIGTVAAYTLEEKKEIKRNQQNLTDSVAKMQKACGAKIKADYDLKSEAKPEAGHDVGTGYNLCAAVVDGETWVCGKDDARPTVVKKLKSIKCNYKDGSSSGVGAKHVEGKPDTILKLQGSTLKATFDWQSANIEHETGDWVMKHL
jgi:hypothetical protein